MKKQKEQVNYKVCKFCGTSYKETRKYCPKCAKDDDGVYHGYTPMSEKKMKIIRIVVGVVLIAVFIGIFVGLRLWE